MTNPDARASSSELSNATSSLLPFVGAAISAGAGLSLINLPMFLQGLQPGAQVDLDALSAAPVVQDDSASSTSIVHGVAPIKEEIDRLIPQLDTAPLFHEAEALKQASKYHRSYEVLAQVPAYHPDYAKARQMMDDNAWLILDRGVDKLQQGNVSTAILHLKNVPDDSAAHTIAKGYLDRLETEAQATVSQAMQAWEQGETSTAIKLMQSVNKGLEAHTVAVSYLQQWQA